MTDRQTILVADDDAAIRIVVAEALTQAGFAVETAADGSGLRKLVESGAGDAAIVDVLMPDGNGLELLPELREMRPELPVIVMSARNTLVTAVEASRAGAFDYLAKPFDLDDLERCVRQAVSQSRHASRAVAPDDRPSGDVQLIGRSPAMQALYRAMARLMGTDLTVLITGESGTGKELVARALHGMGQRSCGPFVAVNVAAIPRELVESELFGHEKGAFTGAHARATGRFEQANGGTLFLDEIGDMPMEAQTRLLRVLQEGEFTTVGGARTIRVDVRIVAATNKDLRARAAAGDFREDLFYRLNVVPLELPPLRARLDDIEDLVAHFLDRAVVDGLPAKRFDTNSIAALQAYRWPGNVRELENLVRRLCVLAAEDPITVDSVKRALGGDSEENAGLDENLRSTVTRQIDRYFAAHGDADPPPGVYARILREVERPLIERTLQATRGNQLKAAKILGLNRNTLRKKLHALDIHIERTSR